MQLAIFAAVLLVGQAVVNHHQIRFAGLGDLFALGGDALFTEKAKMHKGFEDATATGALGMQHAGVLTRGLQQTVFGFAYTYALELPAEHAQVVQGVTGGQHLVMIQFQPVDQRLQAAALVDAFGQEIQIAFGGIQQVAAQALGDFQQFRVAGFFRAAEVGAAAHLRHVLAL